MSCANPAKTKRSPSPARAPALRAAGEAALRQRRRTWRVGERRARGGRRRRGRYCPSIRAACVTVPDRKLLRADAKLLAGARISSADRGRLNSSSGTPRYTTFTLLAGILRAFITNSAVLCDTASAMSVTGSSAASATFWNHGVSVRFACSCRMVGSRRIRRHPAKRRRAIAMKVEDVDLLSIDHLHGSGRRAPFVGARARAGRRAAGSLDAR